jgi:hypothetical protein
MGFDSYPLEVMEQKKRFYAEAIPNRWLVVFTHDHFMPWAYVEQGERGKYALRKVDAPDRETQSRRELLAS